MQPEIFTERDVTARVNADFARLERRLAQAVDRFERVEARLAAASDGAEIVRLGQEHAELKPLVEAIAAL